MRDEQFQKLEALQERLVDVVLFEAEPDHWPGKDEKGNDKLPKDLTQEERGDRYWCKRNASATLTLLNKTLSLAFFRDRQPMRPPEDEDAANDDLDKEIAHAEKKAAELLDLFEQRRKKQTAST